MSDYADYFAERENCFFEMQQVRKNFTVSLTAEGYDQAVKGLQIMVFYCPMDIEYMVNSLVDETKRRKQLIFGAK